MQQFEYKLIKTPDRSNRYSGLDQKEDAFAQTLMDSMNEAANKGWQFVRTERVAESRGFRLFGSKTKYHDYLVFSRPKRTNGMTMDDLVNPRRVQKNKSPDIEQLRARISSVILAENLTAANAK